MIDHYSIVFNKYINVTFFYCEYKQDINQETMFEKSVRALRNLVEKRCSYITRNTLSFWLKTEQAPLFYRPVH